MKKILLSVLLLTSSITLNSQQFLNEDKYDKFIQEQQIPLSETDDEIFLLNEIAWIRLNGEKEFVLSPTVKDISQYKDRIRKADQPESEIYKSTMSFINVQLSELSKTLLKEMNIIVPDYISDNVNVYLPLIDIEYLTANDITIKMLDEYGKHPIKEGSNIITEKSVIWSEDWESTIVPGTSFSTYVGATNCGWEDVDCYSHGGDWSVWCASAGAACNACFSDYVNDMDAELYKSSFIDISNYTDVVFSYWMDVDFNNTGTNDILRRWTDIGTGWVLSVTYNSSSPEDGDLWVYKTSSLSGSPNQFSFLFDFESNSIGTSYGAYLDDLELNGSSTGVGLDEISDNQMGIEIYPNPNNGNFTLELNDNKESKIDLEIFDIIGENVHSESKSINNGNKSIEIDLSNLSTGIYTIIVLSKSGKISKQLIIE
jgi:hypothetical protein